MIVDDHIMDNTTYVLVDVPLMDTNVSGLNNSSVDQLPFYNFVHGLYLYVIPLISILGIIGNVCSFKVFVCSTFSRHPSSIYLSVLSVSDTWFLLALFLGWLGSLDVRFSESGALCMVSVYVTYITSFLSVWYVVLVMFERYIVVCHPLRAPSLCSKKRSGIATGIITAFAILFYAHSFFTMEIVINHTGKRTSACQMIDDDINLIAVITYVDSTITFIIPFIAIFTLNVLVIRAIRSFTYRHVSRHEKKYYSPSHNTLSKAQMRLTVMLMVVSIVFLVLNLPSHGVRFYIAVNNLIYNPNITLFLTQQVCQILYYANFAVNFIVYVSTSKTFRRSLREPNKCGTLSFVSCSSAMINLQTRQENTGI
ncbi:thyrotropin-releasing hormone receptor-like [Pecten maximus]|uniref:thyrotropin-releasing hormone receptor-like n=1 Tax=Pecten maximus TaxID=6579 RepID=UPI00145821B4|nr:thyrotropin-releasing hormone receptor-like [Pecten maximus]